MIIKNQPILKVDTKSEITGLTYPKGVVTVCLERQKGHAIPGCFDYSDQPGLMTPPFNTDVDLSKVPFVVHLKEIENGELRGDVTILDNPCGKILSDLLMPEKNDFSIRDAKYKIGGLIKLAEEKTTVSKLNIVIIKVELDDKP